MHICWDFLDGSGVKNLPANEGDEGLIPGSGRFPGEGNGHPPKYSCHSIHMIWHSISWFS